MKKLTEKQVKEIEAEVKMMLHASRDCLRTRYSINPTRHNPRKIRFDASDGYYGEAFGIFRALKLFGYGYYGAVNVPPERANLQWWFSELQRIVLEEEHFDGNGECDVCLKRYGTDDAGRTRIG